MIDLKETLLHYLYILSSIQESREICDRTPYSLETQRQNLHDYIVMALVDRLPEGIDNTDVYMRSKEILSNLDKVNVIYSSANEWMLKTDEDINHMANDLYKFLNSRETLLYLEGKREKCF
jgi:hypothetical protein